MRVTRSFQRRVAAPIALTVAAAAAVVAGAAPASGADDSVLTHGHIDLFEVTYDAGSDKLVLLVNDDTRIYADEAVLRAPEDVVLVIDPDLAQVAIPDFEPWAFLGDVGDIVYLLPMFQDENLPWPGWNSERLEYGILQGDQLQLDLQIEGPGDVFSFMDDVIGMPVSKYINTTDAEPNRIPMNVGSHTHTNWVFSEIGEYTFTVTATATKTDGSPVTSEPATYRIIVGDPPPSEPVVPQVGIDGADTTYQVGDVVTLTAAQDPQTDYDSHDWSVRWPGETDFEAIAGVSEATYSFTATEHHDGAEFVVNLRDQQGAFVAASPIVTLTVDDGGDPGPGELSQLVRVVLDEGAGALVASVDPDDNVVDLGELQLGPAGDRWVAEGRLRPVTVTDTRVGAPGWQASGRLSDFSSEDDSALEARYLGWTPSVDDVSAGQDVAPGPQVASGFDAGDGLAVARLLAAGQAGASVGTAVLGAGLRLEAPTDLPFGTYDALLTFTVI